MQEREMLYEILNVLLLFEIMSYSDAHLLKSYGRTSKFQQGKMYTCISYIKYLIRNWLHKFIIKPPRMNNLKINIMAKF